MNDLHAATLYYRVHHGETINYSGAKAVSLCNPEFDVEVNDMTVRFDLKQPCTTEAEARQIVEPFIRDWEFSAGILRQPGDFELEFVRAEILDRQRGPGAKTLSVSSSLGSLASSATLKLYPLRYPDPPSGIDSGHPDAQILYQRYKGYREGREPLPTFANFCLSVIEWSVGPGKGLRKKAARQYRIDSKVLGTIGMLCADKGGSHARKGEGVSRPFSQKERQFLERAIVPMIRRVAEYHGENDDLPQITMEALGGKPT